MRRKPITVVTMATSPKSPGTSRRASTMMYTRFRKNCAPCAAAVTSPLEIVRCLRFPRRWSVAKCRSETLVAGGVTEGAAQVTSLFIASERSTLITSAGLGEIVGHALRLPDTKLVRRSAYRQLRDDRIHHFFNTDSGGRAPIITALIEKSFQNRRHNLLL